MPMMANWTVVNTIPATWNDAGRVIRSERVAELYARGVRFIGLGVQPPLSSWGSLIKEGADRMEEYPWLLIFPGAVFSLSLFSLNFLGDGLRDALDVRASKD